MTDVAPSAPFAGGIAVSSRVRLARNVADAPFPTRATAAERRRIWQRLRAALVSLPSLQLCVARGNEDIPEAEARLLVEQHLASREFAQRRPGGGLVLSADRRLSVMVNEEDHLRMQSLAEGLALEAAWRRMDALDRELEERLPMAFSPRWGYLTACPTNVGTGLRASVMLHLAGLAMVGEMPQVVRGIQQLGLAVRGIWGEGTDALGNMYQISNQATLGLSEEELIQELARAVGEVIQHERNARARLLADHPVILRDQVGRAAGILGHAHKITTQEALGLLSTLRLGIESGIFDPPGGVTVDDMFLRVQPAHIQAMAGRELDAAERDVVRATMLREWLSPPRRRRRKKSAE